MFATSAKVASAASERYLIQLRTWSGPPDQGNHLNGPQLRGRLSLSARSRGPYIYGWYLRVVEPEKSSSAVHGGSAACTSVCQVHLQVRRGCEVLLLQVPGLYRRQLTYGWIGPAIARKRTPMRARIGLIIHPEVPEPSHLGILGLSLSRSMRAR